MACANRPAEVALTVELFTRSGDAGRNIVTYQVSPSGFSIGPDGVLRIEGAAAGDHEVTLTAASGLESQSIRITVTVQ